MVIGEPRLTHENGEICVSADVRVETPRPDMPRSLWFRFPAEYREYINERSDAFAIAMLPVAMLLGEDMVVEGRVSPRLAHGIREYQTAYNQWWFERFSVVDVRYGEVSRGSRARAGDAVGCTCSGGVDSFYSIWKHLPENEALAESRITHCLIINGFNFDVDLDRSKNFPRVFDTFSSLLRRHGVELLVARQNAQAFLFATGKVTQSSGILEVGLICGALMLGNLYRRFYVPSASTYRYEDNYPHAFHPSILHLLSSDETEVMFDGGDAARTEKTAAIAGWEETHTALRVCWRPTVVNEETGLFDNCCRCPKCLRTMLALEMLGVLPEYKTFPRPLDRRLVRASHWVNRNERMFYSELQALARRTGRSDLARDLRYARFKSRLDAAIRHRLLRRPRPSEVLFGAAPPREGAKR